jgi:hypothetical protein
LIQTRASKIIGTPSSTYQERQIGNSIHRERKHDPSGTQVDPSGTDKRHIGNARIVRLALNQRVGRGF